MISRVFSLKVGLCPYYLGLMKTNMTDASTLLHRAKALLLRVFSLWNSASSLFILCAQDKNFGIGKRIYLLPSIANSITLEVVLWWVFVGFDIDFCRFFHSILDLMSFCRLSYFLLKIFSFYLGFDDPVYDWFDIFQQLFWCMHRWFTRPEKEECRIT